MATFDLTASSTTGVGANVVAGIPTNSGTHVVRTIQEYLDIDALIAAGNTIADGDVFQMLEIPAGTLVLNAGAEVMKAFTSSCTLDMDFGGGDDIIDGADITSAGFCAAGTNGQTNTVVGVQPQLTLNLLVLLIQLIVQLQEQLLPQVDLEFTQL